MTQKVQPNDWVVVYREDGVTSLIRAAPHSDLKIGHTRIRGDALVGQSFGSTFEMVPLEEQDEVTEQLNARRREKRKKSLKYAQLVKVGGLDAMGLVDVGAVDRDNRNIFDLKIKPTSTTTTTAAAPISSNTATSHHQQQQQQHHPSNPSNPSNDNNNATPTTMHLSDVSLREAGVHGNEIIKGIVQGSATFHQKTVFAQEKYVKKLANKYMTRFLVAKATPRTIAEALWSKHPPSLLFDRHRYLRWCDSLPQMLAYANIHASAKVLCLDG